MRRLLVLIFFILSLAFVARASIASKVYHHPKPAEKLEACWEWATAMIPAL
ncbi:MAG: hypothetical protein WA915_07045 [Candidatus Aminicenantaceae bacterium]